jgi:hypothetical protein
MTDIKVKSNQTQTKKKGRIGSYIIGIATLFVISSIIYTTVVVVMGTEGLIPKLLTIPQAIYAFIILMKRFTN